MRGCEEGRGEERIQDLLSEIFDLWLKLEL